MKHQYAMEHPAGTAEAAKSKLQAQEVDPETLRAPKKQDTDQEMVPTLETTMVTVPAMEIILLAEPQIKRTMEATVAMEGIPSSQTAGTEEATIKFSTMEVKVSSHNRS